MPQPTRIGRLRLPVLCFVVSKAAAKDGDVEKLVTEAMAGGASMIQLRDHDTPAGELLALARRLKTLTRGKALLIINDRVDIAQMMEADGVQLPQEGLPARATRSMLGRYPVVGRSVHDVESARQASSEGTEFLVAGTIYQSASKPDVTPVGAGLIAEITKNSSLPVLAIGGITADKIDEVIKAGAVGVAVISAIAGAADPKAAAEELSTALKEAWSSQGAIGASGMIEQTIRVTLNGQPRTLAADLRLPGLLDDLGIDPRTVAIAYNGDVVPRDRYDQITLSDGDRVEVVRMVGGG